MRADWPAGRVQVVWSAVIILTIVALMVFCTSRATGDRFSDNPWGLAEAIDDSGDSLILGGSRGVAQVAARGVWDAEVGGSSPLTPTGNPAENPAIG